MGDKRKVIRFGRANQSVTVPRQAETSAEVPGMPPIQPVETAAGPDGKIGVLIAVPSLSGDIRWTIGNMFAQAQQLNQHEEHPYSYSHMVLSGCYPTDFARNNIVEFFLKSPQFSWLYMVDADQEVPENWPALLFVNDAHVVSGKTACWVPNGYKEGRLRPNQYSLDEFARCFNITEPNTNGMPYRVPIVGTGCLAIRKEVFAKIPSPPFRFVYDQTGRIRAGEDINFSVACQRAGFVVAVHPAVKFGHVKKVDLAQLDEYAEARHEFLQSGREHTPAAMLSV